VPVGVIQVAQSLRQVDRALTVLLWVLIGGGLVTLLAAARGGLWLTRAALEPIDRVSATAAGILRAADLHRRVPEVTAEDELGRLTRTINALLARLEQVFATQQQFIADVAHELRTPLAAMRGNLEILRRGAIDDPVMRQESLHDIERETLRLTRMANDLLLLAQADAGMALRAERVPLDELLVEVYRELRPLAEGRALTLDIQDQLVVTGDRDRLKQALINLLANAFQHTPPRSAITLGLRRAGDRAVLSVTDTGPGIPPALQATIFDRFVRGDPSRGQGSAGLGLSIVRWVAEAHSGAARVHSEPGRGSAFMIELPLTPSEPVTDRDPADSDHARAPTTSA
jgi:two-component system OmpR family sensor kinase